MITLDYGGEGAVKNRPKIDYVICERSHKGVSQSIDSDDRNFSTVKPQQIFQFFLNRNILLLECFKKNQTYISDVLTLFEYILRIKFKNKCKNEDDFDLFLNGPSFCGIK